MEWKARTEDGIQVLELHGRFDSYTSSPVRNWIQEATAAQPANLIVNLQNVNFVDSTGLATLVQGMKRCRQHDGDLRLCAMQQPVRMIFELTRLDKAFEIFNTEADAVEAFQH